MEKDSNIIPFPMSPREQAYSRYKAEVMEDMVDVLLDGPLPRVINPEGEIEEKVINASDVFGAKQEINRIYDNLRHPSNPDRTPQGK